MARIFTAFVFLTLSITNLHAQAPATIKSYQKIFKTYMFSDPSPIPVVEKIYPYYRFDGFTDSASRKAWKVIELENQYIKLMILPEIGGKIWAAWDKASGRSFIYNNQVVKFRDVAMRGPWTSGGIEPNYGIIGHTPNCATPVDAKTISNTDGSVSCFVGTFDKLTQTSWTIEINLPRDKAYFTTRSFWYNGTALEQPYYSWMNTGMPSKGNLEFIFPGNKYLGHEGEFADWPINKSNNKQISFYDQNDFGGYKSYHVFGQSADFFATYWHDQDFGMGHYSPQDEKPGRKIWIWGLSRQGMIWEQLLTDEDGQYVEIQSGRLFNQSAEGSTFTPFKHRGFAPYAADEWTEYWFPLKHTGGLVKVNPYGGFNYKQDGNYLKWSFCPVQHFRDTVQLEINGLKVVKEYSFIPLHTIHDSLLITSPIINFDFTISNKFSYSTIHDRDTISRPDSSPEDFDWNSSYGLFLQGKEWQRDRQYIKAEVKIAQSLKANAYFIPALTVMAELQYRKMNYILALACASKALSIDTYDPQANFIYGLINKSLVRYTDAMDGFNIAAASMEYRSGSYSELAKVHLLQNNLDQAIIYATKSVETNPKNMDALQLQATISRIRNKPDNYAAAMNQLSKLNPLNHFIRAEEYLSHPTALTAKRLNDLITQEFGEEVYISLSDWYMSINRIEDAIKIISLSPNHAESLYWKAYGQFTLGDTSFQSTLNRANDASSLLQFPYRTTADAVMKFAIAHSTSWKPKYYLALIAWSRGNTEESKNLFERCGETGFAPFYAAYASLDKSSALLYLQKAIQLDPREWRYGKMLVQEYLSQHRNQDALKLAEQIHQDHPANDVISFLLSKTLIENQRYEDAYRVLMSKKFLPNEGSTEGRNLFTEATLQHGINLLRSNDYLNALNFIDKAALWPENLGVGKPYDSDIDSRIQQFCKALCLQKLNRAGEAQLILETIAGKNLNAYNPLLLINAWAGKRAGQNGMEVLDRWKMNDKQQVAMQEWCISAYLGVLRENSNSLDWNHPSANLLKALEKYLNGR